MAAKSGRGDAARGGGAGSRTRVRKCSTTGVYKLSSRFVVDAHAPTSGVGRLQSDWSFECVRRTSPTRHSAAFAPRSTPRKESWRNGARLLFRQRARIQHHHWHLYASSLIDAVTGTRGLQPGLLTLVETKTPPDSQRRCLQNRRLHHGHPDTARQGKRQRTYFRISRRSASAAFSPRLSWCLRPLASPISTLARPLTK